MPAHRNRELEAKIESLLKSPDRSAMVVSAIVHSLFDNPDRATPIKDLTGARYLARVVVTPAILHHMLRKIPSGNSAHVNTCRKKRLKTAQM